MKESAARSLREYWPADLFKGGSVFVTGGGSGINLGIAEAFASLNACVGICGRDRDKLDTACEHLRRYGGRVFASQADVRDFDALRSALESARQNIGPVSVLVCGAAVDFPFPAAQMSSESFRKVVETDLVGSFHASRIAFEQLKQTRGCVLFISGPQASVPAGFQCHVGAAKAAVDNLMRNLALEWGRYGIRANSISPGPIEDTAGFRQLNTPKDYEKLKSFIPLGRYGTIADISSMAVFLASPLASFVTGAVVPVDGGHALPGLGVYEAIMTDRLS
jgi:NAD(P)-dependent dehydrogenase (short-subunit alcohol dehydrogenase family)